MTDPIRIAIFASGGGSNAQAIIDHFKQLSCGKIALIVTDQAQAGVIERAKNHQIPFFVHTVDDQNNGNLLHELIANKIDFIVLAGYLKLIGADLVRAYPGRIVNIHPALLPKYGGIGMYGMNVHRAVVAAGEEISGPTIHYVNEKYDEGAIIEQHMCEIGANDSAEAVQKKVLELEHRYYPACIERLISDL